MPHRRAPRDNFLIVQVMLAEPHRVICAQHDSWTQTYADPQFYAWLLAHKKEQDGFFGKLKAMLGLAKL